MSAELDEACEMGDVATVQACLARGVNVNGKHRLELPEHNLFHEFNDYTPLTAAVMNNKLETR